MKQMPTLNFPRLNKPLILTVVFFMPLFLWAYFFTVPAEDAVILYEYSKNLAERGLITYGGSPSPIEGATDFLWMVIIAAMKKIGFSEFASALAFNFLGIALVLTLFNKSKDRLWISFAILLTPFFYAGLNGFSVIFFVAIYLIVLKLFFINSRWLYAAIFMLCLVRPDGVVWCIGIVLLKIREAVKRSLFILESRKIIFHLFLPGLIYFGWRVSYFSEWLPLPFMVKSDQPRDFGVFFYNSARTVVLVLVPLIFSLLFFARKKPILLESLILFGPPSIFYSSVVLEQNIGNRFMAPLFFGALYYLFVKFGHKAFIAAIIVSIPFLLKGTAGATVSLIDSRVETVPYVARDLADLKGRMLVTEAGRLTFYSGWTSEDSWGLNTPKFARNLIRVKDINLNKYDLIVAHCDLSLLKIPISIDAIPDRTWFNQCKALVSAIKRNNYQVFLLPYRKELGLRDQIPKLAGSFVPVSQNSLRCLRHDIYAISTKFEGYTQLVNIVKRYNAKEFDKNFNLAGDKVCEHQQ